MLLSKRLHRVLFTILIFLLPLQLGKHFWPQWSYVYGLKIDYLSPTLYLTDILVLGILAFWGIEKIKSPARKAGRQKLPARKCWSKLRPAGGKIKNAYRKLKNLIFLFFILVFLLTNCLLAQSKPVAFYRLAKIVEFTFLGFYIAENKIDLSLITCHLSLATIYSSLIALAQFIKQASLNGPFYYLGERTFSLSTPGIAKAVVSGRLLLRPYATFPHPNVLAGFLLISLVLTIPFLLKKNKIFAISPARHAGRNFDLAGGYLLLALSAVIVSFSRSVWLIGLAIGLWFLLKRFSRATALFSVLCCLLFVVGCLLLAVFLPFSTTEALSQRFSLSQTALRMVWQSPILGMGLNNFLVRLPDFWEGTEAIRFFQPVHNIYLLIAAETGLVGLVVFGWFLVLTYKRLFNCSMGQLFRGFKEFRRFKRKEKCYRTLPSTDCQLLIASLTAILLLGFFDHYWLTLQQSQLLLTVVLGLSWGKYKEV